MNTPPTDWDIIPPSQQVVVQRNEAGGVIPFTHPVGRQYSEEARAKASASLKGIEKTPEWRRKISIGLTGKKRSAESRAKQSATRKGVPHSEAHKAALKAAATLRYTRPGEHEKTSKAVKEGLKRKGVSRAGSKNGMFGRRHSSTTKTTMSNSHKGKALGNQNWKKRKPYSSEALRKMSEGGKRRWAKAKAKPTK